MNFYLAVVSRPIMTFWFIMMKVKMCLRKNVSIIFENMKLRIMFTQHFDSCDFFNTEKLVDEFLLNVKNRVGRSSSDFFIKCEFSLENIQPSHIEKEQAIRNSRHWSTEAHQTKLFNDLIYFNLWDSVLKRVINNVLTGGLWHFNRFLFIDVKILSVGDQLFW